MKYSENSCKIDDYFERVIKFYYKDPGVRFRSISDVLEKENDPMNYWGCKYDINLYYLMVFKDFM